MTTPSLRHYKPSKRFLFWCVQCVCVVCRCGVWVWCVGLVYVWCAITCTYIFSRKHTQEPFVKSLHLYMVSRIIGLHESFILASVYLGILYPEQIHVVSRKHFPLNVITNFVVHARLQIGQHASMGIRRPCMGQSGSEPSIQCTPYGINASIHCLMQDGSM